VTQSPARARAEQIADSLPEDVRQELTEILAQRRTTEAMGRHIDVISRWEGDPRLRRAK